MSFSVIAGEGRGSCPRGRLENLVRTAGVIEQCVAGGRIVAGRVVARGLSAIERGVVATRMLRDGFQPDQVLEVLG